MSRKVLEKIAEYFEIDSEELMKRYTFLKNLETYQIKEILRMFGDYYELIEEVFAEGGA